ncbi:MAG: DNA-binding response regulator [Cytophagales bacterium CG18_big_fil_WC_8_21_14_2_50_42_9]|nr:MAG: DNA-binding response regulator [Cytophagales bacterium CG18_big_fil_WC_8_21_14_2_50_42_9]
MVLKCIAIDDEPLALELIKAYAAKFPVLHLLHTFDDAISGAEFLRSHPVDLLFVDINMPDITGLDLVRALQVKPMTIFTTAYKNFAYEGFELEAIDYLLKPIDPERFARAIQKAADYYHYKHTTPNEVPESLFVYSEYRMVKIDLPDIEYIESLEDYIKINLENSKPVLTLMPLKKVLEKLPANKFKRIHRSYIVPFAKVKAVINRKVQLTSGKELPISDSYINFVKEWKQG